MSTLVKEMRQMGGSSALVNGNLQVLLANRTARVCVFRVSLVVHSDTTSFLFTGEPC